MNGQLATNDQFDAGIIASLVINGDLSRLSPEQKVAYYRQYCERLGLDAISQPFKLMRLNGKEVMYCDRSGAQQLNKIHKVSHDIKARETVSGCYVVTVQASTPDGRHTESIGAVNTDGLKGEALCNAFMKAETKAKRRATLDLLGLGMLDESEAETIPNAQPLPAPIVAVEEKVNSKQSEKDKNAALCKKKYETKEEIEATLKLAKQVKDVANLYYVNAELVEQDPALKLLFTDKKNELEPAANRTV